MPLTAPFFGLYPGGMESRLAESGDGERELPRRDVPSTRAFTTVYAPVDLPAPGTVPEGVVQAPALPGGRGPAHRAAPRVARACRFRLVQYCDVQHRHIPRLRRQVPEPFLEIHSETAARLGVADGEWVIVETRVGRIRLKARLSDSLHPGVVSTVHGWWQGCRRLGLPGYDPLGPDGSNANLLVSNDEVDPHQRVGPSSLPAVSREKGRGGNELIEPRSLPRRSEENPPPSESIAARAHR
jgi:Molydopterin dinucleotide binding domain